MSDLSLVLQLLHVGLHAHVRSHVSPGMDCLGLLYVNNVEVHFTTLKRHLLNPIVTIKLVVFYAQHGEPL